MPLLIDTYAVLIFLGIVQGLFLVVIFLSHLKTNRANLYAALFILTLCLICLEILFNYTGLTARYLFLIDFSEPLNYCIAPLFYLAIRKQYFDLDSNHALHFALATFYFFYCFLFWMQPEQFKQFTYLSAYDPANAVVEYSQPFHHDPWGLKANLMEMTVIQLIVYFALTVQLFRKNKFTIKGLSKSAIFKRVFILSLVFILAIVFVRNYFDADLGDHFLAVSTAIFIYYLSFLVYTKSYVLNSSIYGQKYSGSKLSEADKATYQHKIVDKFEKERIYLDSGITLLRFSKMLTIPVNQLSQVVNECFNMNFNELVNSYRIMEAQKKILDPDNADIKIEEIGYQCGFNSKSAFFSAFKKFTKKSPSVFRKSGG